jgi:predicted nucleotidyltransferase
LLLDFPENVPDDVAEMLIVSNSDGMEMARRGAAFLYGNGVRNVWVFGSVAKGRQLDARSDIDLAAEGLSVEELSRCAGELETLLKFPVDLVEIGRAGPVLRARIERHSIFLPREDRA